MTTFIIVALIVVAVIVGNLLLLRPSSQDRRLTTLREEAKRLGAHVRLQAAPAWLAQGAGKGMLAQYQWPLSLPESLQGRWRWHEGLQNWQPVSDAAGWLRKEALPVPPPAGWQALDILPNVVIVYWQEDAESASVGAMYEALKRLVA